MTDITDQLNQFREFALARISSSTEHLTLDELYDEWRLTNPDQSQVADDARATAASLRDYHEGIQGKPAADVISKLKPQLPSE